MESSMIKSIKPIDDIERLMTALIPFAEIKEVAPNRKFPYTNDIIGDAYLIIEGIVNVHRVHDGMLMASAKAPVILGLTNKMLNNSDAFFFSTKTRSVFGMIPITLLKDRIGQEDLWECYSTYLMYLIKYTHIHSSQITALPAYEVIRNQLINLVEEHDNVRLNTNAAQYIQERTMLSRSGIMSVLSQLNKGGYIIIKKGVLTHIDKLPKKY